MMKPLLIIFTVLFGISYITAQINYDEAKVPKYILPSIITLNNGKEVTNSAQWENVRRDEILEQFKQNVYGSIPDENILKSYKVIKNIPDVLSGKAKLKEIVISLGNKEDSLNIQIDIYLPSGIKHPSPIFVGLNFYGNHTIHTDTNISITKNWISNKTEYCIFNNKADDLSRGVRAYRWPVERIISQGFGLATIYYGDLVPDDSLMCYEQGLFKLFGKRTDSNSNSFGAISGWAYGLSLAMDYFEIDKDIDENNVAVIGHSRLGKAALWAGAQDERFKLIISNNSGCGGSAISRRKYGETVKRINTKFPHWFCYNFKNYNDKEDELPVDQHMIIALAAPRYIYVASAEKDRWADPKGEFISLEKGSEVYKFYNLRNIENDNPPEINEPIWVDHIGYHIRSGGHDITKYDWENYLKYFSSIAHKLK